MDASWLRLPAERLYREELEAIERRDTHPRPEGWRLSPQGVKLYLMGGNAGDRTVTPKYIGDESRVELCIAALLTDRALLLAGPPGTGKTWLSEHLAAAVSGDSTLLVQGTMGTTEEHIRYGWNYALLIAHGPSEEALTPSPLYRAMEEGRIVRLEELSRLVPETQDALISLLSEKTMSIPELGRELRARKGFSLIATANSRDKGTHAMSAALSRRFCRVELGPPATLEAEVALVSRRVAELARQNGRRAMAGGATVGRVVTLIRELREGSEEQGRSKKPEAPCSPSDAIAVLDGAAALADSFGDSRVEDSHCARMLPGTVILNPERDRELYEEYARTVLRERGREWKPYLEC